MDATLRKSNAPIKKSDRRMQPFHLPMIRIAQSAEQRCLRGESIGELLGINLAQLDCTNRFPKVIGEPRHNTTLDSQLEELF